MTASLPISPPFDVDVLRQRFFDEGFAILRSAVPSAARASAMRAILKGVGDGGFGAGGFADGLQLPGLMTSPAITSLYSPALSAAAAALAGAPLRRPAAGQVALRFPGSGCLPGSFCPVPRWESHWHIDGLPGHLPSFAPGTLHAFALLVGVALEDVGGELAGALTVFPRGHRALNAHLNEDGRLADVAARGDAALPRETLPLAAPLQVALRAGDAVLAHYQMPHAVAPLLQS